MKQFKHIVVGIGLKPGTSEVLLGSRKALAQARWLAQRNGAKLTLLHATRANEVGEPLGGDRASPEVEAREPRAALDALVEECRGDKLEADLVVVEDRPWLALTRHVLETGADLVLAGKREAAGEGARRIGMDARKLLHDCPCPVWLVKPEHDLTQRLVLAATDLSPVGEQACRYGAYVAAQSRCELQVVHVFQVSMELQMEASRMSDEEYAERLAALRDSVRERVLGSLRGSDLPGEPTVNVVKGVPSTVILEAVERLSPDLLVMGTLSREGIPGLLMGNTAERLVDRVDCSLLTVKPDSFRSPVAR